MAYIINTPHQGGNNEEGAVKVCCCFVIAFSHFNLLVWWPVSLCIVCIAVALPNLWPPSEEGKVAMGIEGAPHPVGVVKVPEACFFPWNWIR